MNPNIYKKLKITEEVKKKSQCFKMIMIFYDITFIIFEQFAEL